MESACCQFFFQAEDGIRDIGVTGVQTCALPILRPARPRLLVPADDLHRRLPRPPDRPRRGLRPRAVGADLPHARRGGGQGEQQHLRPVGRHLDGEGVAAPQDRRPAARRRGVGQHLQQVRPHVALRRLQAVRLRPRGRPPRAGRVPEGSVGPVSPDRLAVRKTYKLYVNGAFPRSESGRSYEVTDAKGHFLANAAWASRKDARDAVVAARGAFAKWSGATAYNRGQVLYRVAEVMEGRHVQFCDEVAAGEGLSSSRARAAVDAAIDRWVWYAWWTDKLATVLGGANPVAGPYFDFSLPEPTGVVAVLAPQRSSLLGLVSVLAPVLAGGNTAVVVTSKERPLPAVTLGEVLATSDVPAGVANLLTGDAAEIGPWLAEHDDVDAIDLTASEPTSPSVAPADRAMELECLAAASISRAGRPPAEGPDWSADPGLTRLRPFLETKTVWRPIGL